LGLNVNEVFVIANSMQNVMDRLLFGTMFFLSNRGPW
jgi:hypothetical protein